MRINIRKKKNIKVGHQIIQNKPSFCHGVIPDIYKNHIIGKIKKNHIKLKILIMLADFKTIYERKTHHNSDRIQNHGTTCKNYPFLLFGSAHFDYKIPTLLFDLMINFE